MVNANEIQEHMEVVGSCGNHVGTVDHVEGDRIKLTRQDSQDGRHHYLAMSEVRSVEGGKVRTAKNHLETIAGLEAA